MLTLYCRMDSTVSRRPSRPLPSPCGRDRARRLISSSGGYISANTFLTGSAPLARIGAASSAARMKGTTRALTASISWGRVLAVGSFQLGHGGTYVLNLVRAVQWRLMIHPIDLTDGLAMSLWCM